MEKQPVGLDLFCGVGGMSLGFEQAGINVIAGVDADQINIETYKKNFPSGKAILADVSKLSGSDLRKKIEYEGEIDVLFGGPPCGGFSMIGKRNSKDPRNELLLDFARLVKEITPNFFVVENVRGLLIGEAKLKLEQFLSDVKNNGYSVVSPIKILNAMDYGIPQNRQRAFILGYKHGLHEIGYPTSLESPTVSVWDAIGDLPKIDHLDYLFDSDIFTGPLKTGSKYAKILRSEIEDINDVSLPRKLNGNGLSGYKRTVHGQETTQRFESTIPGTSEKVSRFFKLSKTGVSRTLRAGADKNHGSYTAPRPIHPTSPRCITVREGARLHSFPDWFQFHPTIWNGFRQVGNSVPPLLARVVAKKVIESIYNSTRRIAP